ncbi:hypothetical protein V3C99_016788 [Haemonchus contortus]
MANLLVLFTTALLMLNSVIDVQAQLQECIGGGVGRVTACLNGMCPNATFQCITTSSGQLCCATSQIRTIQTTTARTSTATTNSTCVDRVNSHTGKSDCPYVSRLCGDSKYSQVMRTQCPKTCGFCSVNGSTVTPLYSGECRDLVNAATGKSDCGKHPQLCNNPIYKQLMSQQCPKTCGYC